MDALSNRLAAFLRLMRSSALLITDGDRANMDVLLTMLGQHIIDTDLRRIAISPEWQMMWRKLPELVKKRAEAMHL